MIKTNPAFVFASGLLGGYFGKLAQVAPPPSAARTLSAVEIGYKWDGLGTGVAWNVTAHDLTTKPTLQITGANTKPAAWSAAIGIDVAALGHSLASFMPIPKPVHAVDCTDNYPDWTATLTFDDGSKLELATNGSNLLGLGGPWQMTLGGITYLCRSARISSRPSTRWSKRSSYRSASPKVRRVAATISRPTCSMSDTDAFRAAAIRTVTEGPARGSTETRRAAFATTACPSRRAR